MRNLECPEGAAEKSWRDDTYWAEKGEPKEAFEVLVGEKKVEVCNFTDVALLPEQLRELEDVVKEFSQLGNGVVFDRVRFILIDNNQLFDQEFKEGINGMGVERGDGIIKLYPRALKPIGHRVPGVSNFAGTLIHEFSHALVGAKFYKEWQEEFGWVQDKGKLGKLKRLGLLEEIAETQQKNWEKLHPNIFRSAFVKIFVNTYIFHRNIKALSFYCF